MKATALILVIVLCLGYSFKTLSERRVYAVRIILVPVVVEKEKGEIYGNLRILQKTVWVRTSQTNP